MRWPDFLVIGAAKSGTSSLYHYLNQHPQIFLCPVHEPNFFALEGADMDNQFQRRGEREAVYRFCITDRSAYTSSFASAPSESLAGEISPLYLYSPQATENIKVYCPQIKLIAILRHPADRAFSNFRHYRKAGIEPILSFEEALQAEDERIRNGWGPWPFWHYMHLGFYGKQLCRYRDMFPKEQILVCLYDEFIRNPINLMQKIFAFLEIDATFTPNVTTRHNLSTQPKSKILHVLATRPNIVKDVVKNVLPFKLRHHLREKLHQRNTQQEKFNPELRSRLIQGYREDILLLQDLTEIDLSHWLS